MKELTAKKENGLNQGSLPSSSEVYRHAVNGTKPEPFKPEFNTKALEVFQGIARDESFYDPQIKASLEEVLACENKNVVTVGSDKLSEIFGCEIKQQNARGFISIGTVKEAIQKESRKVELQCIEIDCMVKKIGFEEAMKEFNVTQHSILKVIHTVRSGTAFKESFTEKRDAVFELFKNQFPGNMGSMFSYQPYLDMYRMY